jgi:4-hydroxybenzoate polyprenyltransferase
MIKRIRILVALARPSVVVLLVLFAMTGLATTGHSEDKVLAAKVLVVVIGFLLASVVVNDLADEAIDRVNLPGDTSRLLVAGASTRREFRAIAVGSCALSLTTSALLGPRVLAAVLAGFVLSLSYSLRPIRLSDRGAVASLLLPAGYVAVPFLVGVLSVRSHLDRSDWILLGGLYVGFIGRILLKDFRDVRGDTLFGKRTFLVRHGRRWTCAISGVCWVIGAAALAGVHGVTTALVVSYAAHITIALTLLWHLSKEHGGRRDVSLISAIAITGRSMIVTVIAHLTLLAAGYSSAVGALMIGMLLVTTLGQVTAMVRRGPRSNLTVPTEWSAAEQPGLVPAGRP